MLVSINIVIVIVTIVYPIKNEKQKTKTKENYGLHIFFFKSNTIVSKFSKIKWFNYIYIYVNNTYNKRC